MIEEQQNITPWQDFQFNELRCPFSYQQNQNKKLLNNNNISIVNSIKPNKYKTHNQIKKSSKSRRFYESNNFDNQKQILKQKLPKLNLDCLNLNEIKNKILYSVEERVKLKKYQSQFILQNKNKKQQQYFYFYQNQNWLEQKQKKQADSLKLLNIIKTNNINILGKFKFKSSKPSHNWQEERVDNSMFKGRKQKLVNKNSKTVIFENIGTFQKQRDSVRKSLQQIVMKKKLSVGKENQRIDKHIQMIKKSSFKKFNLFRTQQRKIYEFY